MRHDIDSNGIDINMLYFDVGSNTITEFTTIIEF